VKKKATQLKQRYKEIKGGDWRIHIYVCVVFLVAAFLLCLFG